MKLSELNTDRAADVLIELTPYAANILKDETLTKKLGKAVKTEGMSRIGIVSASLDRLADCVPFLLKDHRADLYGILSVLGEKSVKEIAEQNIMTTLAETRDILKDEDLITFFRSFSPQEKTA